MMSFRQIVKWIAPPILLHPLRKRAAAAASMHRGDYASWGEATAAAEGYQAESILEIQRAAMRKVRDGQAVYERDSVLFDQIEYFFPSLSALLHVAGRRGNGLTVLDFGGALGSSYYQNRGMLSGVEPLRWHVVEQPHFVAAGQAEFTNEHLRFFPTIESAWKAAPPDIVLFSSVLQYLDDPWALLDQVQALGAPFILVDRTPVLDAGRERLVVQVVPPSIYTASYACRLFEPDGIPAALAARYSLRYPFQVHEATTIVAGDAVARYRGYFFERRERA